MVDVPAKSQTEDTFIEKFALPSGKQTKTMENHHF